MMKLIVGICLFLASGDMFSQSFQISGYITDIKTGEKLIGANIYLEHGNIGTFSNEYGYYSIQSETHTKIIVSYIGYNSQSISFESKKDTILNIALQLNTNLGTVTVEATRRTNGLNVTSLEIQKLDAIPSIAGESDLMKSLTFLPGVSNGKEGSSNLYIRGGSPDQNLILLDEIPVYNASHLGGYLSVFNTKAIKKIEIYKGNFPARFGDRLSSVIDIHMKDGNNKKTQVEGGIGILTSNVSVEGPLKKNVSSYIFTARYSYLGLLNLFKDKKKVDDYFNYWLYDFNGKINIPLSKGVLYLSTYTGNDYGINEGKYTNNYGTGISETFVNKNKLSWGNRTFAIRYSLPIKSKMFANVVFGQSRYIYQNRSTSQKRIVADLDTTRTEVFSNENSRFTDLLFKTKLHYSPTTRHTFLFGLGLSRKTNTIGYFNEESSGNVNYKTIDGNIYIEDKFKMTDKFISTFGIRTVGYLLKMQSFYSIEPRISLNFLPKEQLSFNLSFGTAKQNLHLLSRYGFGIPNDIWVPSTDSIPLQSSWQLSFESKYKISKYMDILIATYYKSLDNLIDYKAFDVDDEFILTNWEKDIVKNGIGKTYGLEFSYTMKKDDFFGLLSYTMAISKLKFSDLNQGDWFLSNFDRRNDITGTIQYEINDKWNFSSSFIFQTGRPLTLPVSQVPLPGDQFNTFSYTKKNNARFPNYHRLDISFEYKRTSKKGHNFTTRFFIYNLYNRKNPNYINIYSSTIFQNGEYKNKAIRTQLVSFFSIIPGINFNYKF